MKNEKRIIALEIAVCVAFIFSVAISSLCSLAEACEDIKENVLRLHVIANSDSDADQSLKLKVRDAILGAGGELFSGETDVENVVSIAESEIEYLTQVAQKIISENGFDYGVRIEIGKSRFPTREYESVTLPAGEYTAVKVIIGEGKGHNWWCVMFPPMCLPGAQEKAQLSDVISQDALNLVGSGKKYEVKFKIVEIYENIKSAYNELKK